MAFMKDTSQIARRMQNAAKPPPPRPPKLKLPSVGLRKGGKVKK